MYYTVEMWEMFMTPADPNGLGQPFYVSDETKTRR